MADGFERFSGFPRVIGAVDGCHIPIRTPSQNLQSYLNRLRSHSIILQVINYASVNSTSAHLSPPPPGAFVQYLCPGGGAFVQPGATHGNLINVV